MTRSIVRDDAGATTNALWVWLALGLLACACIPQLRGRDPFWGWLPFWCVIAPLLDLALLHRVRLAATSRAFLAGARRRRRPVQQALRLRTRRVRHHRAQVLGANL
jgi:hypothetical protein